jgi:Kef-type K+ transport system membrane component KefB
MDVDSKLALHAGSVRRTALFYGTTLTGAVLAFLVIDSLGKNLGPLAPSAATAPEAAVRGTEAAPFLHVLIALTAVLITGRLLSLLFRLVGQPPVIGEVVAGILLGPSFLGQISPAAAAFVLPPSIAPYLGAIAQLGIILYMFLVGLQLNPGALRERAHATIAISHASIVVPLLLGAALALFLYPRYSGGSHSFRSFALFIGVAMSVTAFPVLARILTDRGLERTGLGRIALGCAATDDVTAWCLLAFAVGISQANLGGAALVLILTVAYIGMLCLVVRPLACRLLIRFDGAPVSQGLVALVLGALLLSALATEAIGIHALFGAFLFGAILPHQSALAQALSEKMHDLVTVLFLPAFFAFTGMRTEIGLVGGLEQWCMCGLIIVVATAGKFGGTLAAARVTGLSWREAAALGALMNTRGLMELIVLNLGLDLKIIAPPLYAMMVLMALATTLATTPLLRLSGPGFMLGLGMKGTRHET